MRTRVRHHTETYEWSTPEGVRHSAECLTCDWTTVQLPDPARVEELAEAHRRHPSA